MEKSHVSRNRARTQVLLKAQKLHVYGIGACGAFGLLEVQDPWNRGMPRSHQQIAHTSLHRGPITSEDLGPRRF